MLDETTSGSAQPSDSSGSDGGGAGEQSPLQACAPFLQNWDWQLIVSLNRGACERGGAQHGFNSEAHQEVARRWEETRQESLTLAEVLEFLRRCHRDAPFLFFNGNTFAEVGRRLVTILFADLPPLRLRESGSIVAHYIAGVLDWDAAEVMIHGLWWAASFAPGDRVQTLRGSMRGTVIRILDDGRVVFKSDTGAIELTALPESLRKE
jgi:hypothetical protein